MVKLLCIGGYFDGQRKEVETNQNTHRFFHPTVLDTSAVPVASHESQEIVLYFSDYRIEELNCHIKTWLFLVPINQTTAHTFDRLFNSYESVRQANESKVS